MRYLPLCFALSLLVAVGCVDADDPVGHDPHDTVRTDTNDRDTTTTDTTGTEAPDTVEIAAYRLTIHNEWSESAYPANFPEGAHFSHLGGGTHNASVSFWGFGEITSDGMQEMAETGNVNILVEQEIAAAIDAGAAWQGIYDTIYTPPLPAIAPGVRTRTLAMHRDYPLVTLATMLGPSPDWFVGVNGLSLWKDGEWVDSLSVDLPLYDGGSKQGMIPLMGGPDEDPRLPVGYVRYDRDLGQYVPTTSPQIVGRMVFVRVEK